MGSGENSPAMVTPHQKIMGKEATSLMKVNIDTPYGFQENADELSLKIEKYFESSVGQQITTVSMRSHAEKKSFNAISEGDWIFSGPGSPTYALKIWQECGVSGGLKVQPFPDNRIDR